MVTGCSGYIGSVMCKLLKEEGHDVLGVDLQHCSHKYLDNFIQSDIRSNVVGKQAVLFNPDAIFHFAASADVGLSVESPGLFYHNNIGATSEFVTDLVEKYGWRGHFIFSSTAAVYGWGSSNGCDERDELAPCNPYGESKLMCEQFLTTMALSHKFKLTMFRYFNVAGAWDDMGDHLDAGHIIPRMCSASYFNRPFTLFGNDHITEDGTCVRDYVHVRDICRAHLHAFYNQKTSNETYNLGSGTGFSNLSTINAFRRFVNEHMQYIVTDARPGDPPTLVAVPDKFKDDTGFVYEHTNLERMITSSWDYYRTKMKAN